MMMKVVVVLALVALACAQTPARPNIPADYEAEVRVEQHSHDGSFFGDGVEAFDSSQGRAVQNFRLHKEGTVFPLFIYELQRFDLGKVYEVDSTDYRECKERDVTEKPPAPYAWVANATYAGKDIFRHVELDVWRARFGTAELEVKVLDNEPNRPVVFYMHGRGGDIGMEYARFNATTTFKSSWFDVPDTCRESAKQTPTMVHLHLPKED